MYDNLISNSITILLGLIAGMIALYQIKLNVISNSRIKWIENLRETLSDYLMEISSCNHLKINLYKESERIKKQEKGDTEKFLDRFYEPYLKSASRVEKLQAKLFLYFNSNNKKHKIIESLMIDNFKLIGDLKTDNRVKLDANISEIINTSKLIFKNEWIKSKKVFKL